MDKSNVEATFNFPLSQEINMYYCGRKNNIPNHKYGPAMRDHYLLVYVINGKGIYRIENKTYSLSSKCLFVVFPNSEVFYQADGQNPWGTIWVGVNGPLADKYFAAMGVTKQNPIIYPQNCFSVQNTLESIIEIAQHPTTLSNQIGCISLLHTLFSLFANNTASQKRATIQKSDYIQQATNFIKFNYERGISSIDVARHLNIERSYFSKLFKGETGYSPTEWINNFRIQKACILLKDTDIDISTIAYSVGIFDQFYFSRLFKSITGYSPKQYRNQN